MKSIKIKLNHSNQLKINKLRLIVDDLQLVSNEYLPARNQELQTKSFKAFKEHYSYFRGIYPNLNSGVLQNHLRNMDGLIKSHISWCKKKHKLVSWPTNVRVNIPLRNDMFHFEYNKTTKTFDGWIRFLRTNFPLKLCKYHIATLKDLSKVKDSSIYLDRDDNWVIKLVFETKKEAKRARKTIGIDVGIVKPIVFNDGHMIGSGKHIKHKKIEYGKKRARHQSLKQQIRNKQSRWTNDLNHKLSREVIQYCLQQEVDVLHLEALKGSQLSNKRFRKYNWAFKDLLSKITYKAQCAGLKVVSVDPHYTSQTCSQCGLKSKDNRLSQDLFACKCGYKANADINAAKNICSFSGANGPPVNLAKRKASISKPLCFS